MHTIVRKLQNGLIVSCQALVQEPLFGPEYMAKMAFAAKWGGAHGIRANSPADIKAIRGAIDLPIIGIYKYSYPGFETYITPTFEEARQIAAAGADIIAIDATTSRHPVETTRELIYRIQTELQMPVMADVSTVEEAFQAFQWGADLIATTLHGYTQSTAGKSLNPEFVQEVVGTVQCPVIAEGGIRTPTEAVQMIEAGAFAVVVGSAITRPQDITKWFVEEITKGIKP